MPPEMKYHLNNFKNRICNLQIISDADYESVDWQLGIIELTLKDRTAGNNKSHSNIEGLIRNAIADLMFHFNDTVYGGKDDVGYNALVAISSIKPARGKDNWVVQLLLEIPDTEERYEFFSLIHEFWGWRFPLQDSKIYLTKIKDMRMDFV
jgi:hypothetical protein